MDYPEKALKQEQLIPTTVLVVIVLLASWMGAASGGYFVKDWTLATLILAAWPLVLSIVGLFPRVHSPWSTAALGLFTAYTGWTFASLLWSPNQGDAWIGAGQTLLYLLAFWLAVGLLSLGASRRWVIAASVIGPAIIGALALLTPKFDDYADTNSRLGGTIGYSNGEAAFLLVPFWGAIYLAGSRQVNPLLRGLVLAGATLCVEIAVLTQSRGAVVAMIGSLVVFFLISGQRLRGLFALIPVSVALLISVADLNGVYLTHFNEEDPAAALEQALPVIWLTCAAAGLYGLIWGAAERWWRPPANFVQAAGAAVLLVLVAACVAGVVTLLGKVEDPGAWATQKVEAFTNDERIEEGQSRYLHAAGWTGRYSQWQVAWKDFASHPLLGVGTNNYEATYYQLRKHGTDYARHPHSLPLEVLAERGLVGGVLFFGFMGVCLAAGLRRRFEYRDADAKALIGALIAAVAYWFFHSSLEWFWQIPAIPLLAIVYLGMLVAPRPQSQPEPLKLPQRAAIVLGAALAAALVVAPLYVSDRYLTQSYATDNPQLGLEAIEHAQRFNPLDHSLPVREAKLATEIGDRSRVEKAYDEAVRLNPEHYVPYKYRAQYYE